MEIYHDQHQWLAPDVDQIADSLAIDWSTTPLPQIEELVKSGRRTDAVKLYREHFGCSYDDAFSAIRFWDSDTTARRLRYLAKVMAEMPPTSAKS